MARLGGEIPQADDGVRDPEQEGRGRLQEGRVWTRRPVGIVSSLQRRQRFGLVVAMTVIMVVSLRYVCEFRKRRDVP